MALESLQARLELLDTAKVVEENEKEVIFLGHFGTLFRLDHFAQLKLY
jgi:hypothetical protein